NAGVGVALDVTRARAQLAATRAQLIAARSERDRSRLDLARALGMSSSVSLVLRDSLVARDSAVVPSENAAIDAALNDRQDLRAATVATETARTGVKAARAERLPKLGVFGDNGTTSNTYPNLLGTYTWGVQLQVPVFEGMRISSHIQQQTAALRDAEA